MSLKVKLKRVFFKARKFCCFILVFLISFAFFTLSVSAETVRKTSFLTLTKARATDYYDSDFSSFYTIYPVNMISPFGGTVQAFKLPDNESTMQPYRGINANMYFDAFQFKKDVEYNLSFKIVIAKAILNPEGISSVLNDLVLMGCSLCDSNRERRINFVSSKTVLINESVGDRYIYQVRNNWEYGTLTNVNSATFGFFECNVSFVPSENFNGTFFNFYYDCYDDRYQTGYFGFSDLVLSYEIDPLTDPNYSAVNSGSVNDHNKLENSILEKTTAGRETATGMIEGINDLAGSDLFRGLLAWSSIIEHNLTNATWFSQLLKFSLSIGLFAFLLGLGIYAVSIHSSKVRRENSKNNRKGGGG